MNTAPVKLVFVAGPHLMVGGGHSQSLAVALVGAATLLVVTGTRRWTRPRGDSRLDHWGDALKNLRALATGS